MILYDHPASGNCMKARILLRQLDLPYERVTVDLFTGETRTPEHFARNPDGRVPVLELDSGETIPEVFANRLERGKDALGALDRGLADGRDFVAGDYSIADIALYAYVHCAGDAGADLGDHDHIGPWLERVEATPAFENDLEPLPAHALQRPV